MNNVSIQDRKFKAELSGVVNGAPLTLHGGGTVNQFYGRAAGFYQIKEIPRDFEPAILSACLLTGYPNICALRGSVVNPFGNRPYRYSRRLTFRNGGELTLKAHCWYEDGKLMSTFRVAGEVRGPELSSVDPIIESWVRISPSTIKGEFEIAWHTPTGELFIANAQSEYVPDGGAKLAHGVNRHIDVTPSYRNGEFSLKQESELCEMA